MYLILKLPSFRLMKILLVLGVLLCYLAFPDFSRILFSYFQDLPKFPKLCTKHSQISSIFFESFSKLPNIPQLFQFFLKIHKKFRKIFQTSPSIPKFPGDTPIFLEIPKVSRVLFANNTKIISNSAPIIFHKFGRRNR